MEDIFAVTLLTLVRFGIPIAVMSLIAVLYSRAQKHHVS
jgi:hypothetical protein